MEIVRRGIAKAERSSCNLLLLKFNYNLHNGLKLQFEINKLCLMGHFINVYLQSKSKKQGLL